MPTSTAPDLASIEDRLTRIEQQLVTVTSSLAAVLLFVARVTRAADDAASRWRRVAAPFLRARVMLARARTRARSVAAPRRRGAAGSDRAHFPRCLRRG